MRRDAAGAMRTEVTAFEGGVPPGERLSSGLCYLRKRALTRRGSGALPCRERLRKPPSCDMPQHSTDDEADFAPGKPIPPSKRRQRTSAGNRRGSVGHTHPPASLTANFGQAMRRADKRHGLATVQDSMCRQRTSAGNRRGSVEPVPLPASLPQYSDKPLHAQRIAAFHNDEPVGRT